MPGSEVSSLDSSRVVQITTDGGVSRDLVRSNTENIVTRTSTILSYIKEDNRFAKTQVEPNPSYDPNELIRVGTAAPVDDAEEEKAEAEEEKRKAAEFTDLENIKSESFNEEDNDDDDEQTKKSTILEDTGEYNVFDIQNKPPDKGFWAWTAAVCVLFINTFSWGTNAVFGVYLNYYTTTNYFPGATMEQYVMIGGLGLGLSFMACTITNSLCRRFHYKLIMSIGTGFIFLSYWLASIAKTVVQMIMFQGLLMSVGFALVAGSTFVILPTWFLKKRSIAQGIATAGGGLGGIVFARPIDEIIKRYTEDPKYADNPHEALRKGIAWALRMESFVSGFMLVISIMLLRTYRPLRDPKAKSKPFLPELYSFFLRVDLLEQVPMICLIFWNMVYGLTYTILLFSLSSYATTIGLTYKQGSNVTTVQSVAQTVGRPLLGICSDRIGRVNTTVIFTLILTILIFLFWIFVTTYSELLAFAFLAGFILGVNWVNFGPMAADIVGAGPDLTDAISILMFTGGMPLIIAELVGLKLKRPEMSRPFLYCQILCGVASLVSALLLMPFREWKVKRILLARRKHFLSLLINDTDNDDVTMSEANDIGRSTIATNSSNNTNTISNTNANSNTNTNTNANVNSNAVTNADDDNGSDADQAHVEEEIKRLDAMLKNNMYAYTVRMFYPIAV